MKTVATVTSQLAADIICAQLRAFGIESFVPDQGLGLLQPFYSQATAEIRIQVAAPDYERARALLETSGPEPSAPAPSG